LLKTKYLIFGFITFSDYATKVQEL